MKKALLFGAAMATALVSASLTANQVSADTPADAADTQAPAKTMTSTATFTIGKDDASVADQILLTAVPSFQFNKEVTLSTMIKSGYSDEKGTASPDTLAVSDLTGTSAGWTVSAQMGAFSYGKVTLNGGTLNFAGTALGDGIDSTKPLTLNGNLTAGDGSVADVLTAPKGSGQGTTTATVASPSLTLPKQPNAANGAYSSTITWAVGVTPAEAQAAAKAASAAKPAPSADGNN
ncbi:WxL domain-containing protein [Lacticaseibacillus jixianensis]|uniref:WxL domain-containing protein n=1 Tax=Lacticaseibacillus jixianensis TaxID=2486012 RepID=A0ABW4BAI8_9LACO|nr:WxL domain-containing protein [Lacticaseibacillus jixianensis]